LVLGKIELSVTGYSYREMSPPSSTDIYIPIGNEAGCNLYTIPHSDGKLTLGAKFVANKPRPQNTNKT